jgi:hypothetical protein
MAYGRNMVSRLGFSHVRSPPRYTGSPDWIPGATTLAQAKKNCRLAPLTGGGTVTVTQWKTKPANSDFSCG